MQCTACNIKKQAQEQRRRERKKLVAKARKVGAHANE